MYIIMLSADFVKENTNFFIVFFKGPHNKTTAIHVVRKSYFLNKYLRLVIKMQFVSNLYTYKLHIVENLVSSKLEI